jgi:hypothetical protein
MNKFNFPAVQVKSPSESLVMLGVDEGEILEYNPASGMYVVSKDGEPGDGEYPYFAEAKGFSKKVIEAFLEAGIVEELLVAEEENTDETVDPIAETEAEVTEWDKADLTMVCGRCENEEKVTGATGGVTLFMPTTSLAETRLVCSKCGNKMSFVYRNGDMFTEEERAEFELSRKIQTAEQTKARAEQDLEILSNMRDEGKGKEASDEPQEKSK